jgi:oxepin-CoA hydrolase/3-oxo-5,6-dehydrosuberyl-CoA semialdehyde dehydrogenase
MIKKLQHYALGGWHEGSGDGEILHHAITGEPIFSHTIEGLDFKEILQYGRTVGNPALRKMTFQERGMMLKALAFYFM